MRVARLTQIGARADQQQLKGMAAAFAALPSKVLWRLTAKEVPDEAAMAALELGNNTQVPASILLLNAWLWQLAACDHI